jgi:SAM-dependent methyltransferase
MASSTENTSRRGFSPALVTIVCVCLVGGATIWYFLSRAADVPLNSPPPERQGLNAPFIKTPNVVVDKMVELAELKETDVVYDLGCGDGRLVITAALKSGCSGTGFDIEPERVAEATENAKLHEVEDRVQIVEQDVFTVDMSKADVALMYVLPWMMNKLLPQFQEMKDGCRIVAHDFWIDGVEPETVIEFQTAQGYRDATVYLYRTPLVINPALEKGKPPHPREGQIETITLADGVKMREGE